ncbi:zinc ABC transporter substrate-binding protein [Ureibacillus composti]|nr:zinc ABC transporter substrate-binding protein [Ureibacillus composti]
MKRLSSIILLFVVGIILTACNADKTTSETNTDSNKINVYTTVYPLSFFAEEIGGDYVNVSSIYPPGSNEHTFEPTQQDMMKLADADIFFYIGLGLEGFVENAKKTLANENVTLVATADHVSKEELLMSTGSGEHAGETEEHDHEDTHNHGEFDPHVWLSPTISQDLALAIKEELVKEMPEQENTFNANYENLVKELETLNNEFEKMASEASSKTFFVSHSAFGYIAGQYGLEQVAIAGMNSQSEPSQKELTKIVDLAEELNIKYILFEQNVSSNLTSTIQQEVGAKSLTLHNLSVLTEEDVQNNEDYFTLMNKNIETLRTALNP